MVKLTDKALLALVANGGTAFYVNSLPAISIRT